jgi:hypothetical protein
MKKHLRRLKTFSTARFGTSPTGASRSGAVKSEAGAGLSIASRSPKAARCSVKVSGFIPMPIAYQRTDGRRLITVTVTEPYSVDDIFSVIDRQGSEDTWNYALLYDLRAMTDASIGADLPRIADRVKAVGGGRERGQVGVAIPARPALFVLVMMYTKLIGELATVEVLLSEAQIDSWLARNAPGGRGTGGKPT